MEPKKIILFGTGPMAEEYLKVLRALNCQVWVVGRDTMKAKALSLKYQAEGLGGGIDALSVLPVKNVDLAIAACAVESLQEVTESCCRHGIPNILVEKPGALNAAGIQQMQKMCTSSNVRIAYNRRFYNAVIELKNIISHDKPTACFFDFTDRQKDIEQSLKSPSVTKCWGWANSSHVIDTAFFLIGMPIEIKCLQEGAWEYHPSGNVFAGCGRSAQCLFSYGAAWEGGGRWSVEVTTRQGRYKLSPMEKLQFCAKNQFEWKEIVLPDDDDTRYKPGLLKMVRGILFEGKDKQLPSLSEQVALGSVVNQVFGYED